MNKTGKNLSDLQDSNRSEILNYIIKNNGCSRADIGKATGLTLASITKLVRPLIEHGLIFETGFSEGEKGRRAISLSFNYERFKILAIKLTWTQLELRVFDFRGTPYDERISVPFTNVSTSNIDEVVASMINYIEHLRTRFPEICAIGMAVPGPYFRDIGALLLPPYSPDPSNRNIYPIINKLQKYTSLPIFMEHDAAAGSLGYWWFNPYQGKYQTIMNILADNGVGIGLVDDGRIYTGTKTCSCEMGHISIRYDGRQCSRCGGKGCINAYCSTESLEQIAAENIQAHMNSALSQLPSITYDDIFRAMENDDKYATDLVYDCGRHFGYGILSLLHVFDSDVIIISGAISKGGDVLMNGIQDALEAGKSSYVTVPEIRLLPSEKELTLLGATAYAITRMLNSPTRYFDID